jgi:ferredoxin-type protein NapF
MSADDGASLGRRSLLLGQRQAPPRLVVAISTSCLALHGIACMSCRDACPAGAERFSLAAGGARPAINADACTGCAECAGFCPASAIAMEQADG